MSAPEQCMPPHGTCNVPAVEEVELRCANQHMQRAFTCYEHGQSARRGGYACPQCKTRTRVDAHRYL